MVRGQRRERQSGAEINRPSPPQSSTSNRTPSPTVTISKRCGEGSCHVLFPCPKISLTSRHSPPAKGHTYRSVLMVSSYFVRQLPIIRVWPPPKRRLREYRRGPSSPPPRRAR